MDLKIAIESRSLTAQKTGIPRYAINLLTKISEFDDEDEFVLLSDVPIEGDLLKRFGSNWKNIPMGKRITRAYQMPGYIRFLERGCRKETPDVFWAPTAVIPNLRKSKTRSVITVHDLIPIEHPEMYGFLRKSYFRHYLLKGLKSSDGIVFVSETVKRSFNSLFPDAFESKRQFLVFNAVDFDHETVGSEGSDTLKKIGSEYLVFMGTKERRKGILVVAEAAKLVKDLPYKIVVTGKDGDGTNVFREKTRDLENVVELPYVTDGEKNALLSDSSALLFPSLAEGFGIPLIEAAHLKKPVIASDIPIFMEVLDGNYFKFSSGNAESLANVIEIFSRTSDDELKKITERAYQSSKKYDLETEAKKLRDILMGESS